ncbi:MAG: hypothetical protein QOE70_389 [Chthoniobacter sp.]|jgi:uncharacterized protein (DUF2126 family)|nr:hypothetical protein [Chthoniobacter sp.]
MKTPHTDAWREQLAAALAAPGRKADLARFLTDDEHKLASRRTQIARVLNQGMTPEAEFVLATLRWMDGKSLHKVRNRKDRRSRQT